MIDKIFRNKQSLMELMKQEHLMISRTYVDR